MGGSGAGGAKYQQLDEVEEYTTLEDPEDSIIADRAPRAPQMQRLGRYRLVQEIASGGMASVNLAVADGVDKLVALKMIHANLAQEDAFVQMFLDEARIASAISHRNVCNVFDFGETDGRYFLAMDYLSGQSLRDVIQRLRKTPELGQPERLSVFAATLISEACEGLHAAHELRDAQGKPLDVVHRDVSPHNLFVTYEGSVSVVDFGIARASDRIQHTATGVLKGKFSYMAPEQIRQLEIDRRVDIWALGVCLWETLTLERLFVRNSQADTLMSVMMDKVRAPSEVRPGIPKELDDIVMRALARSPSQRYATARDLGRDLAKFVRETGQAMDAVEIEQWLARLFPTEIEETRALLRNARLATIEEAQWLDTTPSNIAMRMPTRSGAMLRARGSMTPSAHGRTGSSPSVLFDAAPDNDVSSEIASRSVLRKTSQPQSTRKHKIAALLLALCVGGAVAVYVNMGAGGSATKIVTPEHSPAMQLQREPAPAQPPAAQSPAAVLPSGPQERAQNELPASPIAAQPVTKIAPLEPDAVHTRVQKSMQGSPALNSHTSSSAARGASIARQEAVTPKLSVADAGVANVVAKTAEATPGDTLQPAAPEPAMDAPRAAPPSVVVNHPAPSAPAPAPKVAEKLDAKAQLADIAVEGSLGTGVVARMLSRAEPLLRTCYVDAARKAGKNQFASLAIALTIDETGAVRRIQPAKHPLSGLSECAANELKRLRSDRKPDVGTVNVHFSVNFKAP